MSEANIENENSGQQKRSGIYPRYNLKYALDFAEAVYKAGGENIPKRAVAVEINIPINSSGFLSRISSAKQFGLIETDKDKLSVTQRAKRIFLKVSDEETNAALIEAFIEPPLYSRLVQTYLGKILPSKETLGNILALEPSYGIQDNARILAATNFISSAEFVGAIKNGMLAIPELPTKIESQKDISENLNAKKIEDQNRTQTNNMLSFINAEPKNFHSFSFDGGMELRIPKTKKSEKAIATDFKTTYEALENFAKLLIEKQEEN